MWLGEVTELKGFHEVEAGVGSRNRSSEPVVSGRR